MQHFLFQRSFKQFSYDDLVVLQTTKIYVTHSYTQRLLSAKMSVWLSVAGVCFARTNVRKKGKTSTVIVSLVRNESSSEQVRRRVNHVQ